MVLGLGGGLVTAGDLAHKDAAFGARGFLDQPVERLLDVLQRLIQSRGNLRRGQRLGQHVHNRLDQRLQRGRVGLGNGRRLLGAEQECVGFGRRCVPRCVRGILIRGAIFRGRRAAVVI